MKSKTRNRLSVFVISKDTMIHRNYKHSQIGADDTGLSLKERYDLHVSIYKQE